MSWQAGDSRGGKPVGSLLTSGSGRPSRPRSKCGAPAYPTRGENSVSTPSIDWNWLVSVAVLRIRSFSLALALSLLHFVFADEASGETPLPYEASAPLYTINGDHNRVRFSRDGRYLLTDLGDQALLVDAATGVILATHDIGFQALDFQWIDAHSAFIAVGDDGRLAKLECSRSGPVWSRQLHNRSVTLLFCQPGSDIGLVFGDGDDVLQLSLKTGDEARCQLLDGLSHSGGDIYRIQDTKDSRKWLVGKCKTLVNPGKVTCSIIDSAANSEITFFSTTQGDAPNFCSELTGRQVAWASTRGMAVCLIDGQETFRIPAVGESNVIASGTSPPSVGCHLTLDGRHWCFGIVDDVIRLVEAGSFEVLWTSRHLDRGVRDWQMSPEATCVAVVMGNGRIDCFRTASAASEMEDGVELWKELAVAKGTALFDAEVAAEGLDDREFQILVDCLVREWRSRDLASIIRDLDSDDPEVRENAAASLKRSGGLNDQESVDLLDRASAEVRARIAEIREELECPPGRRETTLLRRLRVVSGIGRSRSQRATEALVMIQKSSPWSQERFLADRILLSRRP